MTKRRSPTSRSLAPLGGDASAQSETVGVLLLLAVTIIGTVGIVAFGTASLSQMEQAANFQQTEHTMTLLDSRSTMVALGDSEMQAVTFSNGGDGTFRVAADAGWIKIKHSNFSDTESGDELIYNASLGTFLYQTGETTIAYQGGGAWRIDEDGEARMVSQPEFHYVGSTLTLPIVRITGSGEASGRTTVTVSSAADTNRVFPDSDVGNTSHPDGNETGAPYNGSGPGEDAPYENPIDHGNVTVLIHSQFYEAWADYFSARTDAAVSVFHANQTVHIKLQPLGVPEQFGSLQDDISVRGLPDDHTVSNFSVNLTESSDNQFKHMSWSWYAESGSQQLELYYDNDGTTCEDLRDDTGEANIHIIYKNGSGGHGDQTQEWSMQASADDAIIEDVTCPSGSADSVVVNWTAGFKGTSTDETLLVYDQLDSNEYDCAAGGGSDPSHEFGDELSGCSNGDGPGTAVFDDHDIDGNEGICPSADPCDITDNEQVNSSFLVNHYMALLGPNYEVLGAEHSDDRIDETVSSGGLYFTQSSARFLQYLHITENEIEIDPN